MKEDGETFSAREVTPFVADAWVDETYRDEEDGDVGCLGYEINVNRHFYRFTDPRPLGEVRVELQLLEASIAGLLKELIS